MAILRVAQMGHPVLRLVADPVDPEVILTEDFQSFLDDLLETMFEYDGAGLAAPQVHTSIRVACLTLDPEYGPEFLINPEITPLGEPTQRTVEGCLSIDGIRAAVDRPAHVRVEALDRFGRKKIYELKGFPAVVVQHECDHLDGILFVDRADPLTMSFLKEFDKYGSLDRYVEGYEPPTDVADEILVIERTDDEELDEELDAAEDAAAGDAEEATTATVAADDDIAEPASEPESSDAGESFDDVDLDELDDLGEDSGEGEDDEDGFFDDVPALGAK